VAQEHGPSSDLHGDPARLSQRQQETVLAVLDAYGSRTPNWLSRLTHREQPWIDARSGLPADAQCRNEITPESMRSFYGKSAWGQGRAFAAAYLRGLELFGRSPGRRGCSSRRSD
jgi:hypothetical protein